MKRFLLVFLSLLAGFAVFSFLARTGPGSAENPDVFVHNDMPSAELVLRDAGERFHPAGFFEAGSLQSYIVSNPDALFITDKEIASGPYSLKNHACGVQATAVRD